MEQTDDKKVIKNRHQRRREDAVAQRDSSKLKIKRNERKQRTGKK